MVKILFLLFAFILSSLTLTTSTAYAADNFATSYSITYDVKDSGMTHATIRAGLTNITGKQYATSYKVEVGFPTIENVRASDPGGAIKPIVTKTKDGNAISLAFNSKVAGAGKTLNFTISFDTPDIARQQGKIWEINIPGIADNEDFKAFTVQVNVPKSFGQPSYIKPEQSDGKLHFTKEELGKSGIAIAYGTEQIYHFDLKYNLKNKNVFPITTEIALPPATNYQDIVIEKLEPKPTTVKQDNDGNWLAIYNLLPSQTVTVTAQGTAVVHLNPKQEIVPDEQLKKYLLERPYWQVNNKEMKKLANELKTPDAIYDYVVKTLNYDFSRVSENKPRLGAVDALRQKHSAVCLEFTDLFITLARAAGIPAREVDGFAFTRNERQRPLSMVKDILHAWPEYYDKSLKTWIMVDPTWGSTTRGTDYFKTFDYDHVAFVLRGEESEYPIPAGGYKVNGSTSKDISVAFGTTKPTFEPLFSAETKFKQKYFSGFPVDGVVTIHNTGGTLLPSQEIAVISDELTPKTQTVKTGDIPPFGFRDIAVSFDKTPLLTNKSHEITIRVADKTFTQRVDVVPLIISDWRIVGGIAGAVLTLGLLIIAFKTRRLHISR
jgi:transglutaminase-like putative cysteine protease